MLSMKRNQCQALVFHERRHRLMAKFFEKMSLPHNLFWSKPVGTNRLAVGLNKVLLTVISLGDTCNIMQYMIM